MNERPDVGRQGDLDDLIGTVAREMTEAEPPRDLAGRVRDRVEGPRASRPGMWPAAALAALILLAAVIGTVLRAPGGTPPDRVVTTLPPPQPDAPPGPPPPAPPVMAGSEDPASESPRAAGTEDAARVFRPAGQVDRAGRDFGSAAGIDPPPQVELAPLPGPEPLMVSVAAPAELAPPGDIVLTDIAVRDLTIPPLDPWKESR